MAILVGGSVALDTIDSPFGKADRVLGGSASYFAYAASYLTDVSLVSVVGEDFPDEYRKVLEKRRIDLTPIEVSGKPTFNWHGKYHEDMNQRDTLHVDLSIFEGYSVKVPDSHKKVETLCLANMSPENQLQLIAECPEAGFILADTMNLWIEIAKDDLLEVLKKVNLFILNDSEALQLSEEDNVIRAGRRLLEMGAETVCIKKGEHGVTLFSKDRYFVMGAYPLEKVLDPTGAGDCFAGGLAGYIDKVGKFDFDTLRDALSYATTAASFCVEDFSFHRLLNTSDADFMARHKELMDYVCCGSPS